MDAERIRSLRLASPFRPFVLIFKDGRRFPVPQPYLLSLDGPGKVGCVAKGTDDFQLFAPSWVLDIEWLDSADDKGSESRRTA